MSDDYTPTTEEVRADYVRGARSDGTHAQFVKWQKGFDRWLAAHDAEVLAAAGVTQPEPARRATLQQTVHLIKAGAWEPVPNQEGQP